MVTGGLEMLAGCVTDPQFGPVLVCSAGGVLAELLPLRPRNYHAERFRWGTSWREIERTVRLGRSDVMPSFEGALDDREIRSVAFLVACWVAQRDAARAPSAGTVSRN